jgi:hypothetical protein
MCKCANVLMKYRIQKTLFRLLWAAVAGKARYCELWVMGVKTNRQDIADGLQFIPTLLIK